jgi:hypothetical protein
LKPERWGSLLVQEKYQEEKACDKRHPYRIIIIYYLESTSRNYRHQPHWARRKNYGK